MNTVDINPTPAPQQPAVQTAPMAPPAMPMQPDPFAEVNRKFEAQRKRLEASLQELKANRPNATPTQATAPAQVPVVQQAPPAPPKADPNPMAGMNKVMMEQGVAMMLAKIAQALTVEEQEWVSANLISLPGFMSSNSGKAVIQLVFKEYREWMEK